MTGNMAHPQPTQTTRSIAYDAARRIGALVQQDALDPYSREILESAWSFLNDQDFLETENLKKKAKSRVHVYRVHPNCF